MKQNNLLSALVLGLLLAGGLVMFARIGGEAALGIKHLERTVTVKGLSEREVPADLAIWYITFEIATNELPEFYQQLQDRNRIIIDYLSQYSIQREEINLNTPVVNDMFAKNYSNNNIKFRYTGSATVTVYSRQIDKVREAMTNIVELGQQGVVLSAGDYRSQNQFLFSGLNDIKPAMIEEATRNAREAAGKFAADSDSKLGKIKTARQGQFSITDRDATTPHIKKVRVVSTVEYYLSD